MKRRGTADQAPGILPSDKPAAPRVRAVGSPAPHDVNSTRCLCSQDARHGRATFDVAEMAQLLGLGRDTIYEAARRGELPGMLRIGRRIVFARAAVLAWLGNPAPSEK